MGCIPSSTAASSAYPGNRRVAQPAYQPSHDEYKQIDANTAVAQAHFVTCPGGNALRLLDRPNRTSGDNPFLGRVGNDGGLAKYISVTLPSGVNAGDVIHVKAPDGRMNAIVVPEGMGPGSTFTVEFASDIPPEEKAYIMSPGVYVPTVVAEPEEADAGAPTSTYGPGDYGSGTATEQAVVAQPTTGPYVPA